MSGSPPALSSGEARRQAHRPENAALRELVTFRAPWPALYADDVAELALSATDQEGIGALAKAVGRAIDGPVAQAAVRLAERGDGSALSGTLRLLAVDPKGLGRAARKALAALWQDPQYASVTHRLVAAASPQTVRDVEEALGTNQQRRVTQLAQRLTKGRG